LVFLIHTELRCTVNHTSDLLYLSNKCIFWTNIVKLSAYILTVMCETKFHTHVKQELKFLCCIFSYLYTYTTKETRKFSGPNDAKRSLNLMWQAAFFFGNTFFTTIIFYSTSRFYTWWRSVSYLESRRHRIHRTRTSESCSRAPVRHHSNGRTLPSNTRRLIELEESGLEPAIDQDRMAWSDCATLYLQTRRRRWKYISCNIRLLLCRTLNTNLQKSYSKFCRWWNGAYYALR